MRSEPSNHASGNLTGKENAHARIIRDYFEITSRSCVLERGEDYRLLSDGLRRGLRGWLTVHNQVVFDLGCGTGELSWLLLECGAKRVVGINLSEKEIGYARDRVCAEFVCQDILTYLSGVPDAHADTIFAMNILEHLTKDDLVAVLEQSRRCLRTGGHLVALVPNATSNFGSMTRYWDFTHHIAFTPSSVKQLQRLCKFRSVEFREWGPVPHGVVSFIRFMLWQGIRSLIKFRLLVETASTKSGIYTADMLFRLTK